jgi:hypothetical protein
MTGILFFAKERILPGYHVVFKILEEMLDPCWMKVLWGAPISKISMDEIQNDQPPNGSNLGGWKIPCLGKLSNYYGHGIINHWVHR